MPDAAAKRPLLGGLIQRARDWLEATAAPPRTPVSDLALFGKHPAWKDHLSLIGARTEVLTAFRQQLYGALQDAIEHDVWRTLGEDQRLATYSHIIVRDQPPHTVLATLSPSTDVVGRDRYPLVCACQLTSIAPLVALPTVLTALQELRADLLTQQQESTALAALEAARAKWQTTSQALPREVAADERRQLLALLGSLPFGEQHLGLQRLTYRLVTDVADIADLRTQELQESRARLCRVPRHGLAPAQALRVWLAFVRQIVAPRIPVWISLPGDGHWLDIFLGYPKGADLYALLALPQAIPLTSDVPFTLPPDSATTLAALLAPDSRGL